jgi:regulator of RNase E activity RraA
VTDDYAAAFAQLGSATLGESGGHPMAPRIKAVWNGARVSAPAYPVTCATADNLAIHVAVAEAPAGPAAGMPKSTLLTRTVMGLNGRCDATHCCFGFRPGCCP